MDELILVRPSLEYDSEIMKFRKELMEAKDEDYFAGCGSLKKCDTTREWLSALAKMENEDTCPKGYVPSSTYLAVRTFDNRAVGIIDLRHHINHPVLSAWGGHIGYSIRPSERGKGYGKEMLKLVLQKCRERNMDKVMVSCSRTNAASGKVILANGGVFDKEVCVDGEFIKRYWIAL